MKFKVEKVRVKNRRRIEERGVLYGKLYGTLYRWIKLATYDCTTRCDRTITR